MWNLWRAWIIAQQTPLLEEIGTTVDPRVRLGMALIWALAYFVLAGGLWRRHRLARIFLPLMVLLYGAYEHLLLLFMPTPAARLGWVLQLLTSAAAVGWATWVSFRPAYGKVWTQGNTRAGGRSPSSPIRFKVVQRGHNGESKN